MSYKGKEKCKDEAEATTSGPQNFGSTRPADSQSKNPQKKGGQGSKPNGAKTRDNPVEQWQPRQTKAGNPKARRSKNGRDRGGYKALITAVTDAESNSAGLKDALREQSEETHIQQEANMHLRRDLTETQRVLKEAEEKLGVKRSEIDLKHSDSRKTFRCQWTDSTAQSYKTLILLAVLLPVMFVGAALYLGLLEILLQQYMCTLFVIYEGLAVLLDRYLCTKRGCRAIFSARATHSYSTLEMKDWDDVDRRADTMSLRELKHVDPKYGVVKYTHTLNGRNVRRDAFGDLAPSNLMLISFELLSQLTTPLVMLARDQVTAWDRMEASAKSTHTINIDKDLFTTGCDVVGNTLQVAHGLWLQNHEARLGHFRPTLV